MTPDSDDRDGLRGLARSIDRLFTDVEAEPGVGTRDVDEREVAEREVAGEEVAREQIAAEDAETAAEEPPVDAFWEMDEIASVTEADETEGEATGSEAPELHGAEFDAEELEVPELDDAEVAASGLGGHEFDPADLDRIDYDAADFDSAFDDEAWADLLDETTEATDPTGTPDDVPEPDEAPAEDPEWGEMGGWGLDLVGGDAPEREAPPEEVEDDGPEARSEPPEPVPTAEAGEPAAAEAGEPAAEEAPPSTLFARAVDTFLAGSDQPTRARTRIQHYAEALVQDGDVDEVADGIERLSGAGGDAVEIAREVLSPPVAYLLAMRLARFSGEDERKERIGLAVRLGYDFAPALSSVLAETENKVARYALVDALVAMGVDGWDAVVEMVGDERWWVVRNAVLVLGRTGGEESVRFLTRTIEHDDPRVRLEAVEALEEIGGIKARDRILSRLDDEAPPVRAAAVRAVGSLEIEGARERLRTMLEQESDEAAQLAVIETLGRLGDEPSIARLEEKLEGSFFRKPTTEIRAAVYGAFGAIGTPRALELLRAASEEKDPVTRTLARRVLRDREGGEGDAEFR